jgi:hypothetical protein
MKVSVAAACAALFLSSTACKKFGGDSGPEGHDASARPRPTAPVPAPTSSLAQELGTDDAGRGDYRFYEDGPWCGLAPRVDRTKPLGPAHGFELDSPSSLGGGSRDFFVTEKPPREGPSGGEGGIRLVLTGPTRTVVGMKVALALDLRNGSTKPLHYARALDGSFEHWRSPFVDVYARDESFTYRWTYTRDYGRCGNVDAREADDFIVLPPGGRKKKPFGAWSDRSLEPKFERPGTYTVWVVYAACTGAERGLTSGNDVAPPNDLFDGTIASNALQIEVMAIQ